MVSVCPAIQKFLLLNFPIHPLMPKEVAEHRTYEDLEKYERSFSVKPLHHSKRQATSYPYPSRSILAWTRRKSFQKNIQPSSDFTTVENWRRTLANLPIKHIHTCLRGTCEWLSPNGVSRFWRHKRSFLPRNFLEHIIRVASIFPLYPAHITRGTNLK